MGLKEAMHLGDLVEILDDYPPRRAGTLAIFLRYYETAGACFIFPLDTLKAEMYHRSDVRVVSKCEQERSTKDLK
jgi:hypothetical protein